MLTTTDIVAIEEMVNTKFEAAPLDRIVGQPSLPSVRLLVEQLAPITANTPTIQWGGQHGHLKMVLGGVKFRVVIDNSALDSAPIPWPSLASTALAVGDDAVVVERKREAHKIL